jgi:hypothetical protein
MLSGKKMIEILPDLACCEKEELLVYHPFDKMVETYCPVHGGKIFSKDLNYIFHISSEGIIQSKPEKSKH